jgi:TetR/AcrR family transcriptional repressor of mexJK operon
MKKNSESLHAPIKRGRPLDETKQEKILDVAACLFLKNGFHATSMDDIAAEASMSKLTLYRRFPDKNALFVAVIECKCQEYVPDEIFSVFDVETPRSALFTVGKAFFSLILSDDAIGMYRMMAAEASHNPALTQLFYDTGPKRVKSLMTEKIAQLAASEGMHIPNPEEAKNFFIALFTGADIYMRRLLNIAPLATEASIIEYVDTVTDLFMRQYGV